tara:strand:+ start:521 stop:805 length:285 start_codon:yes stop_codon:yes gene_type:complete
MFFIVIFLALFVFAYQKPKHAYSLLKPIAICWFFLSFVVFFTVLCINYLLSTTSCSDVLSAFTGVSAFVYFVLTNLFFILPALVADHVNDTDES